MGAATAFAYAALFCHMAPRGRRPREHTYPSYRSSATRELAVARTVKALPPKSSTRSPLVRCARFDRGKPSAVRCRAQDSGLHRREQWHGGVRRRDHPVGTSSREQVPWNPGVRCYLAAQVPVGIAGQLALSTPGIIPHRLVEEIMVLMNEGSTGEQVIALQAKLKSLGFDPGAVDGDFGPNTTAAVVAFQTSKGLTAEASSVRRRLRHWSSWPLQGARRRAGR